MFGRKNLTASAGPEKVAYTRYYEHDGLLRAYANRAMVLAMMFGVMACTSLGFLIYLRLQPPTVIRVDTNGDATVVGSVAAGGPGSGGLLNLLSASASTEAAPTDIEGRAAVRRFLESYLSYTPTSVDKQLADALNMMTQNLRQFSLTKLREEDTVGKVKEETITSRFRLQSIEPLDKQPWTYVAFGVKEVHRLQQQVERMDRLVARYTVRLIQERRSERNPSGLLVAEYKEEQMVGEKDFGLEQKSSLLGRH
jgi:type IV secretory pathway component VirB8